MHRIHNAVRLADRQLEMHGLTVLHLTSISALRSRADAWDDLWRRSDVTLPTARAELIAQWIDHFAPQARFDAVVVQQGDRFLAALPLVTRYKRHLVRCRDVPGNEWSSAGNLLLDARGDVPAACDALIRHLHRLDRPLFWFASIPLSSSNWWALRAAADRARLQQTAFARHEVGRLTIEPTWIRQQENWSKNFRRQMRRSIRKLRESGELRVRVEQPRQATDACRLVAEAFRLEDRSWKGAARSSVLANPGMESFLVSQACQLAQWGQMVCAFLEYRGQAIASEYGWLAKRVYHSYKISYQEGFRKFSPGQVLFAELIQHFQSTRACDAIDFLGPLDQAVQRWRPGRYRMGRLIIAPRGLLGRCLAFASRHMLPPATDHARPVTAGRLPARARGS